MIPGIQLPSNASVNIAVSEKSFTESRFQVTRLKTPNFLLDSHWIVYLHHKSCLFRSHGGRRALLDFNSFFYCLSETTKSWVLVHSIVIGAVNDQNSSSSQLHVKHRLLPNIPVFVLIYSECVKRGPDAVIRKDFFARTSEFGTFRCTHTSL